MIRGFLKLIGLLLLLSVGILASLLVAYGIVWTFCNVIGCDFNSSHVIFTWLWVTGITMAIAFIADIMP